MGDDLEKMTTVMPTAPDRAVTDALPSRSLRAQAVEIVKNHPLAAAFVLAAVVIRLVFWLYTERVWEDSYITLTLARNVFRGVGLTHHASERVHTFTSALGMLIPLVGEVFRQGLLALRLGSLAASVVTMVFAYRSALLLGISKWPMVFVLGYLAFDQQQVFFGMSGMETQVTTAVLMAGFYYLLREDTVKVSALAGLAVLARPDMVLWAVMALGALALRRDRGPIKKLVGPFLLVVGPWVVFTTAYYGSPIPHTIVTKSLVPGSGFSVMPTVKELLTYASEWWWRPFSPFWANSFVTTTPFPRFLLKEIATVFILLAIGGAWMHRRNRAVVAVTAFVLAFAAYRTAARLSGYFTWYLPPFTALCALLAGCALTRLREVWPRLVAVGSVGLALAFAAHIPFTYPLERRVQRDIEMGVRAEVGRYLGAHTRPGETAVFEPPGYFGWYAKPSLTTFDFPGLTSKRAQQVVAHADPGDRTIELLARELRPDWLVLRPQEAEFIKTFNPSVFAQYGQVAEFRARPDLDLDRGGLAYLSIDTHFLVLRRSG